MRRWPLLAAVGVALLLAAGLAAAEPHITDAEGDATEWNSAWLEWACERASTECSDVFPSEPTGGAPATADRDILSVEFSDTPTEFVVEMRVAALEPRVMGSVPNEGWVEYAVCWDGSCLFFWRYDGDRGATDIPEASYRVQGISCGPECQWYPRVERHYGAPGLVRWVLPRGLPGTDGGESPLAHVGVVVRAMRTGSVGVETPSQGTDLGRGSQGDYVQDLAGPGRSFRTVTSPIDSIPRIEGSLWMDDPVGDAIGSYRTDTDFLGIGLVETTEHLVLHARLARVDAAPAGLRLTATTVVTEPFRLVRIVVDGDDGTWSARATSCAATADASLCERPISVPVELEVLPGSPGELRAKVSREAWGNPRAGQVLASVEWYAQAFETESAGAEGVGAYSTTVLAEEWANLLPAARLGLDTASSGAVSSRGAFVEAPRGDVRLPPLAAVADPAQFDVTFLQARTVAPGETHITLGIADLSRLSVPSGFDAAVYAVAVETDAGAFMAGYYRSEGIQRRQEFFCAQDTLVTTKTRSDPAEVVWQSINGAVAVAGGGGGRGGDAAGGSAITFFVPHTCFAAAGDAPVLAKAVAGGTYLLQSALGRAGQVDALDETRIEGPVELAYASVAAPTPWYVAPFGIGNFWDMLGIGLAVGVTGAGAAVVQRRRGALKRYLREIDQAAAEHGEDARAKEVALVALRDRLKSDLLRNRILDGHYVIVERRLDDLLARARIDSLAEAFGGVPHRLVVRLQALLADGHMSRADFDLFCTELDAEAWVTPDGKKAVREHVLRWVREDTSPDASPQALS